MFPRVLSTAMALLAATTTAAATVRVEGNVAVVRTDAGIFPFDRPFDLEGRTIRFVPVGDGYRIENEVLQWDDNRGDQVASFSSPSQTHRFTLSRFAFPFGEASRTALAFDGVGAIRFAASAFTRNAQLYDVHIAGIDEPLISPLLRSGRVNPRLSLFLREESTSLLATWREGQPEAPAYEIQARLHSNGTIAFSYRRAPAFTNGAVVITSGAGQWRMQREVLADWSDPEGDIAPAAPADLAGMIDVRQIDVARIANSDILQARIRVHSPIDGAILGDRTLRYSIDIGEVGLNSGIDVFVTRDAVQYRAGNWTRVPIAAPAVTIENDTLVVHLSDEMIRWREHDDVVRITTALQELTPLDSAISPILRGNRNAAAAVDFSTEQIVRAGPLFETFSRGYLDLYRVWDAVREAMALRDEDVDAVAVYTDLITDINALGLAYSTVGNTGAAGIMLQADDHDPIGPAHPVRPALMHLADAGPDIRLLLHELGHRWLLNVQIDSGGGRSLVLNRDFHPTAFVHNPSAFPKVAGETSCMGGTHFAEISPGTFIASRQASCGYSWMELYLMGLAAPEEVPPWFHVRNPDRDVPDGSPAPIEVRATKEGVVIDDLLRGMGPRNPSAATSRKAFRVVFVVVDSEREPATEERLAVVNGVQSLFAREFARVTGGRGAIDTTLRRGMRRRAVSR